MKNVFLIGGTMGVGKTTVCHLLKRKLNRSVFLDGDWCWDMNPFQITDETKQMVMNNICFLLNSFIRCSAYENIVFCWVMHEQAIIDDIVSRLDVTGCKVHAVSLVCSEQALRARLQKDVDAGIRNNDIIVRSMERIPLYHKLNTAKVDVSDVTPEQAADQIMQCATMQKQELKTTLGGIFMFESRCGICCSTCEGKEEVHCKGCLLMEKPFWGGECQVKSCCEGRKLNHCGECPEFPCDVLSNMGKDQGFDPLPKIEMCRKWAAEKQSF